MYGSSLTDGIPGWFNTEGSYDLIGSRFGIPSNVDSNRKWLGYALFVVYEVNHYPPLSPWSLTSCNEDSDPFSSLIHLFKFDIQKNDRTMKSLYVRTSLISSHGPLGFWAYIPAQWFSEHFESFDKVKEIYPSPIESHLESKHIRGRLVYKDNASELYRSITPPGLELEFQRHLPSYLKKLDSCED